MKLFKIQNFLFNIVSRKIEVKNIVQAEMPEAGIVFQDCQISAFTGGVYLKEGFFGPSAFEPSKIEKVINNGRYIFKGKIDVCTTINHGKWNNYYHWYIDSLPRLWCLWDDEILKISNIKLLITSNLTHDQRLILISLLPPNVTVIKVNRYSLFKCGTFIFLPFQSRNLSGKLPVDYLKFYKKRIFDLFKINSGQKRIKLFISRKFATKRRFLNNEEVEAFFAGNQFQCVYLEKLSLAEQAFYFANAEIIIGSHGSGFTNLLYATKCKVIEIFHCHQTHLHHYKDLAISLNLEYEAIYLNGIEKNSSIYMPIEKLSKITANL